MISFVSKKNNPFLDDLALLENNCEILEYDRYKFIPKWLKLFLSQKELCLSKDYISNNQTMLKTYFSFEPLECADSYYIDSIFYNKEFGAFDFYQKIRQKSIIKNLQSSKLYASSNSLKNHIINEFKSDIPTLNIEVQYPSIYQLKTDYKKIKTRFCDRYEIKYDDKILLFKGDDFINDGGKEFINIYDELVQTSNTKVVSVFIASKSQIEGFRFMARKLKSYENIIFCDIDDLEFSIEEIMTISDIYLHPTYRKKFNRDTIKAMYYKNAVFISHQNFASELVDTFSLIENPNDTTSFGIVHKIEALLNDEESLKTIQEDNKDKVKHLNIENLNISTF